ncbi:MAG: YihY/virulence factor BrkB family protein [Proteobacteria bacterium]|nr:YihY/virulence factor BrkB family protein [Pseudomonadota bacterium]
MRELWALLKEGVVAFDEDDSLSRGAAIAFYALTALAPVLYIAAAIAGLVFGREAAGTAIAHEVGRLVGPNASKLLTAAIRNSDNPSDTGFWTNIIGVVLLIVTASGMFGEMQAALNKIWKAQPKTAIWWRLARGRFMSLLLVVALGFLLLISLVMSAAIHALGERIDYVLPIGSFLAHILNFGISFVLVAALLAAIYRALPDCEIQWRDVMVGAIGTTILFNIGEFFISLYLGSATVGYRYGAAGGVIVLLLWIYYTAQIFLLGAEFTHVWSRHHGSLRDARAAGMETTPAKI